MILGIDPGTTESAIVRLDGDRIVEHYYLPNDTLVRALPTVKADHLAIEMVASYGLPVGVEVFETVLWIGRFIQAWGRPFTKVYRKDVKVNLCHSMKANDAAIRQALIDRYGPGKDKAVGLKASPGPLYGITGDTLAALAVGLTYQDMKARSNV